MDIKYSGYGLIRYFWSEFNSSFLTTEKLFFFSDSRKLFLYLLEEVKKLSFCQTCSKTPGTEYSPEYMAAAISKNYFLRKRKQQQQERNTYYESTHRKTEELS